MTADRKLSDDAREAMADELAAVQINDVLRDSGYGDDPAAQLIAHALAAKVRGRTVADHLDEAEATLADMTAAYEQVVGQRDVEHGRAVAVEAEAVRLRAERDVALRVLRRFVGLVDHSWLQNDGTVTGWDVCTSGPGFMTTHTPLAEVDPEAAALLDALAAEAQP